MSSKKAQFEVDRFPLDIGNGFKYNPLFMKGRSIYSLRNNISNLSIYANLTTLPQVVDLLYSAINNDSREARDIIKIGKMGITSNTGLFSYSDGDCFLVNNPSFGDDNVEFDYSSSTLPSRGFRFSDESNLLKLVLTPLQILEDEFAQSILDNPKSVPKLAEMSDILGKPLKFNLSRKLSKNDVSYESRMVRIRLPSFFNGGDFSIDTRLTPSLSVYEDGLESHYCYGVFKRDF